VWNLDVTANIASIVRGSHGKRRQNFAKSAARVQKKRNLHATIDGFHRRPRRFDPVRARIRLKHRSRRTERVYLDGIKRLILCNGKRRPASLGAGEVEDLLAHRHEVRNVSAATQSQARSAPLFHYCQVLGIELPRRNGVMHSRTPRRLPVVLTRAEVAVVLNRLAGTHSKIGRLHHGTGIRVMEAVHLRVKDVEFTRGAILVREGKGRKGYVAVLPDGAASVFETQIARVRELYDREFASGSGHVGLPDALQRKHPVTSCRWGWQYVPPVARRSVDPRSGRVLRHHVGDHAAWRAMRQARRDARLPTPPTPHALRHAFATHLLESGDDIRTVPELHRHSNAGTTMFRTQVLNCGGRGPLSPLAGS
jgi:integron integrase